MGNSLASVASSGVTPATVPGAPTTVTAVAGNIQATVSFTAPVSNGGSVVTGYTVTSNPGSITITGSSSPIIVTGLTNGTSYTFTVVATNAAGNSVSSVASSAVTPISACGSITSVSDRESNSYAVVSIGTRCWMASNLRVTTYNTGVSIPLDASGGTTGDSGSETWTALVTGARTVNAHSSSNLTTYGYLYNWYAVTDSRKICPTGWHVPTDAEWTTLTNTLGGLNYAGGDMKSTGTTLWNSPNTGADNSSGFSALPGGCRYKGLNGIFANVRNVAFFWSTTESATNGPGAWYRNVNNLDIIVLRDDCGKACGFSVRCLKD